MRNINEKRQWKPNRQVWSKIPCSISNFLGGSSVALLILVPVTASAQLKPEVIEHRPELRRGETVLGRSRPELDSAGIRAGGFVFFPEMTVEQQFTDNVFATKRNKKSDQVTVLHPRAIVRSNWNRHFLQLQSRASIGMHIDETSEDYEDHRHFLDGRIDLAQNTEVSGWVRYSGLHQFRSSPDDFGGREPTEYEQFISGGNVRREFGRFSATVGAEFEDLNFHDNKNAFGATINEDDRDRDSVEFNVRVGYEIIPEYEAFIRGAYNDEQYDDAVDDGGLDRDSHGYEVVGGMEVDFNGIIFGDFFAGFMSQNADDSMLKTINGANFGAGLTWIPTGLTSVRLDVERHIEQTTIVGAAGSIETNIGLTVDHELLRNLLLQFDGDYERRHFKGLSRDDDSFALSVHANYLMNRRMNLFVGYTFETEASDLSTQDFDRNLVKIRFTLKI